MADSGPSEVCNFFRKTSKNKNIRKRAIEEEEDEDEDVSEGLSLVNKLKKAPMPDNRLQFSTRSSKRSVPGESNQESDSRVFHFESSKEIQVQHDSRATATLETETEFSRDARAIRERQLKQAEEAIKKKGKTPGDEKLYKGIHGYTDYKAGFRREHTVSGEKAGGAHGPLRASAHIRTSMRFDYQPDICKDYKETGYCGFGDSCKFMHDRGDYKSGWQMEREWEEAEKVRKRNLACGNDGDEKKGGADPSDDEEDDSLPFACFICRESFVDPVVTKCKHYFCEHCALKFYNAPINEFQTKLVLKPLSPDQRWKFMYEPLHHDIQLCWKKIPLTKFLNLQIGVAHSFQMHQFACKWKFSTCLGGDGFSLIRNKTSLDLYPGIGLRLGWRAEYDLPEVHGGIGTGESTFNMNSG